MPSLIDDIEAFLTAHEMTPTAFGERALNDRHFVRQVRNGRRVWPETEEKVRKFMSDMMDGATSEWPIEAAGKSDDVTGPAKKAKAA